MNETARDVLRAAALRGHRQITGQMHDFASDEGECALGVLHLAVHTTRGQALRCAGRATCVMMAPSYGLAVEEAYEIAKMNDVAGYDFLQIASKAGVPEEAP